MATKINQLRVGMKLLNSTTNRLSEIVDMASTSVCIRNKADVMYSVVLSSKNKSNVDKGFNDNDDTKVKGITYLNWYGMDTFDRHFTIVDEFDWKLKRLSEWIDLIQIRRKFNISFDDFI